MIKKTPLLYNHGTNQLSVRNVSPCWWWLTSRLKTEPSHSFILGWGLITSEETKRTGTNDIRFNANNSNTKSKRDNRNAMYQTVSTAGATPGTLNLTRVMNYDKQLRIDQTYTLRNPLYILCLGKNSQCSRTPRLWNTMWKMRVSGSVRMGRTQMRFFEED